MGDQHVLAGLRVLDLTSNIAGPYCTKLFADAGADVVKVEVASGDPLRRRSPSGVPVAEGASSPLFSYLNASKRSVVADVDDAGGAAFVRRLYAWADLVVEDFAPGHLDALGLGADVLHAARPEAVLTSITTFGRGGPWTNRVANEFTLQAQVGGIDYRGLPGHEPVCAAGRIGDFTVGSFAAPASLAAVLQARATGHGTHLDVSQYESMILSFQVFRQIFATFDPGRLLGRSFEIPSIEPAKDGWVGFCTITGQQYSDFCALIGAPELAAPELMFADRRMAMRDEIWAKIRAFTTEHTVDEIVEVASAMRIPVSPVGNGAVVLGVDQFVEREVFVQNPAGFRQPRPPYRFGSVSLRPPAPAPRIGEHTDVVRGELDAHVSNAAAALPQEVEGERPPFRPLAGIKVADFSAFWAGPVGVSLLGALGAEVVKIESIQRPDGMRFSSGLQRPQAWEWSPVTHSVTVGRRDLTLDLSRDEGRALALRLVEWADVVVENFSPRVMEGFGLGWDEVHERNPRAVMVRMPAFGLDGPWRDRTGFAMTIEQASGMAWITGHASGPPMVPRGVCDPIGGMHAAFATMLALQDRERTGEGQLVEVPLIEVGLNIAAEQIVEHDANGVLLERQGNRACDAAPQGVYRTNEGDWWVAVSVTDDSQWQALVGVLGRPDWATDPALATAAGRHAHHDAIDEHLRAWFATRPRDLTAEQLIAAGVPAAPCINATHVGTNIHHDVRPFHQWMQHPVCGWVPYPSFPFTADGAFLPFARPAPTLGQHNREVLHDVLGLDDDAIDGLAERGVIGDWPAWMERPAG